MPDTRRKLSNVLGVLPDNTSGSITPQDMRDVALSLNSSAVNIISTNTTLTDDHDIVEVSTGDVVITLPNSTSTVFSADNVSKTYTILNTSSSPITISNIDVTSTMTYGGTSFVLEPNYSVLAYAFSSASTNKWNLVNLGEARSFQNIANKKIISVKAISTSTSAIILGSYTPVSGDWDGQTISSGDIVCFRSGGVSFADNITNGIYIYGGSTTWIRHPYFATNSTNLNPVDVYVKNGTVNGSSLWKPNSKGIVLGTSAFSFLDYSDLVTKPYVDTSLAAYLPLIGGTLTNSLGITRSSTTGQPSFFILTNSVADSISVRFTEQTVGSIPADVWQFRSGGTTGRPFVFSGFDSTIWLQIDSTAITAVGFKTPTGTSSGFLKADGSVDTSSYITSASLPTNYWTTNSSQIGLTGDKTTSGLLNMTNSTASTSTSTGALVVTGGVGIGGALYGTSANFSSTVTSGGFRVGAGTDTNFITDGGGTVARNLFPLLSGINTFTGANMYFVSAGAIQVVNNVNDTTQRNHYILKRGTGVGSFWALTTFGDGANGTTDFVIANNINGSVLSLSLTGVLSLANSTASTSTTTGALVVTGGVGVGGAICAGTYNAISSSEPSLNSFQIMSFLNLTAGTSGAFIKSGILKYGSGSNNVVGALEFGGDATSYRLFPTSSGLKLPLADGTNGQVLTYNSSTGYATWQTVSGGGGSGVDTWAINYGTKYFVNVNSTLFQGLGDTGPTKYTAQIACTLEYLCFAWSTAPSSAYKFQYSKNNGTWTDFNTTTNAANLADGIQTKSSAISLNAGDNIQLRCNQSGTSLSINAIFKGT